MENKITVIIADDHPLLIQGLVTILSQKQNIAVLGHAADGPAALTLIRSHKPNVAILDVQMPLMDGFKVAQTLINEGSVTKFILLTMFIEEAFVKKVFELGVKGYILKDNAVSDIVDCIESVAAGRIYLSPQVSDLLLRESQKLPEDENNILTASELRIVKLIGEAKSTREISAELFVSVKTVENHRGNICKKLGITGNSALLKYAMQQKNNLLQ